MDDPELEADRPAFAVAARTDPAYERPSIEVRIKECSWKSIAKYQRGLYFTSKHDHALVVRGSQSGVESLLLVRTRQTL